MRRAPTPNDLKAEFLSAVANSNRLQVLQILGRGEIPVGRFAMEVGLSQSALSQHLAKLRASDLVKTRRDAQTIYYSIKSERVHQILQALAQMFDDTSSQLKAAS